MPLTSAVAPRCTHTRRDEPLRSPLPVTRGRDVQLRPKWHCPSAPSPITIGASPASCARARNHAAAQAALPDRRPEKK
ncbi:hypothetical protein BS78_K135300 [Paspalum vaginatum]|uniref:Uncharacterized protein n=1 Tax=Paspalum vaginatum TaxID=158149 RepID=A0A9W7XE25_9POAL|nr:hypothetical protein BS78_K135300 [Paspalum vaginatum]